MKSILTQNRETTDSVTFARIADEIFAPLYPVLARDMVNKTGIDSGVCMDIGAGCGHLGLAIARNNPAMQVVLADKSEDMLAAAHSRSMDMNLENRVILQQCSAEKLPYDDSVVDLVVSRGSIFFWEDKVEGINEIYRVLKTGGAAVLGGGFGSVEILEEIRKKMGLIDPEWDNKRRQRTEGCGEEVFNDIMKQSRVLEYSVLREEAGLWIQFQK